MKESPAKTKSTAGTNPSPLCFSIKESEFPENFELPFNSFLSLCCHNENTLGLFFLLTLHRQEMMNVIYFVTPL